MAHYRSDYYSVLPLFPFVASQNTAESGGESKNEEDGNDSDTSSSSHNKQNGDTKSIKQRTSKSKGNGEKCPHDSFRFLKLY